MFKYLFNSTMKRRNIMINCKRKVSHKKKQLPYHHFVKFDDYHKLLMKNLCIEERYAIKVLWHQRNIFNIPKDHVAEQCRLCMKWNIDVRTLYKNAALLGWTKYMLENRVMLLQEMGMTYLHAAFVSSFRSTMDWRMSMFKAFAGLPKKKNIAENLLSFMDQPPAGVTPMETPSENLSVNDYYKHCLQWYIQWKLHIPKDDDVQMSRVIKPLSQRSFRAMRKMFDILHNDVGLTIEEIKEHDCLVNGSAEDLRMIIDNIPTFYGVNMKELIKSKPLLHSMDYGNVVEVMKLLDKHGFNETSINHYPEICILPKIEVETRFQQLQDIPELRVLKNNSNALRLIFYFGKVQIRLAYLRYVNIKQITVSALTGNLWMFEKYVKTGKDTTTGKEVIDSVVKRLKLEPRELHRRLSKHPYWCQIDLVLIHDTLDFLLERFKLEDLTENIQLILYSREKIAEVLNEIRELNEKHEFYTPRQILALIMYEIERECHFSGDGVWRSESTLPKKIGKTKISDDELTNFTNSGINSENEDIKRKFY